MRKREREGERESERKRSNLWDIAKFITQN
jgi:hypothetical protein